MLPRSGFKLARLSGRRPPFRFTGGATFRRFLRSHSRIFVAATIGLSLGPTIGAPAARAAGWYVRPGGGGDATTIQGGLALAQPGDVVRVAAGTYMEHDLQLPTGVMLIAESGRDSTTIDAQGLGHGVIGANGAVVQGFTIMHAGQLNRHAVYCYQTSPAVLDNRFIANYERTIVLYQSTSEIARNEFVVYAPSPRSHLISSQSTPWVHDNLFDADDPGGNISAIELFDTGPGGVGAARIENNVIYGSTYISGLTRTDTTRVIGNVCVARNGFSGGFSIAFNTSPLLIMSNTMVGGSGMFLQGGSRAAILRNIVVDAAYGIQSYNGEVILDCNDVFHCQTPYAGVSPGPHDFSANPLFCNAAGGNYHLQDASPCSPAHAPESCGLVGALEVACGSGVYTITATAGPGGTITPNGQVQVGAGTDQTFTMTSDPGYQIANVQVDTAYVGPVTSYTFNTVASDHTIAASFRVIPLTHTITATATPGGTILPSGAVEVSDGANQTFVFFPSEGWRLIGIVVDGVPLDPVDAYTFYDVVADHAIRARFTRIPPPPPGALEANQIRMLVSRGGSFALDPTFQTGGLEFPKGSGKTAVFASGLWLGANVYGAPRVAVSDYSDEFGPGAILDGGIPDDPNRPEYRVYRLDRRYASAAERDSALAAYGAGAVPHGAPLIGILPDSTLDIPGDQMLWHVYNDADPARHTSSAGHSQPLGVEIQQTAYAFNRLGALGNTAFLEFKIINKGPNLLEDLYAALWSDPDLGGSADDLLGCDSSASLGYCYNGTNNDLVYGSAPPAVGYDLLSVAKAGVATREATSFVQYTSGGDPRDASQSYNFLHGLLADGSSILNPITNQPTRHFYTGDPITRVGWLDANPGDRRFLLCSGPFTLGPGQSVELVGAIVIGDGTDRLSSIATLRNYDDDVQRFFEGSDCSVAMSLTLSPRMLSLHSLGHWVTARLEPPAPWTAEQIDVATIRLNGTVPVDSAAATVIGDFNHNGIADLAVKFNRAAVGLGLKAGAAVPVAVTGTVGGQCFAGNDTIRVLGGVVTAPTAGSVLSPGPTTVRWEIPKDVGIETVALLASFDDGVSWRLVATDVPNSGSYVWTAPSLTTDQARIAIVVGEPMDESGALADGMIDTSDRFSIAVVTGVMPGQAAFALRGITPNPARSEIRVSFSLANSKPAYLTIFDVTGRQLESRRVDGLGPGWHTVEFGQGSTLRAGLYMFRLTQGGRSITRRAALVR